MSLSISVRVSGEVEESLEALAESKNTSVNAICKEMIERAILGGNLPLNKEEGTERRVPENGTDESGETVFEKLPPLERLEALMLEVTRRLLTEETGGRIVEGFGKLAEGIKIHTSELEKLAELLDTPTEPVSVPAISGTDNGTDNIREKFLKACFLSIGHRIFALHKNAGLCSFGNLTATYAMDSFKNFRESYPSVGKNQELLDIYKQYVSMFARLIVIDHIIQRKPFQEKISDGSLFDGRNDGAYGMVLHELTGGKAENMGEQKSTLSTKEGV